MPSKALRESPTSASKLQRSFPGANTFSLNKRLPGLFLLQILYRANGSVSL